MKSYKLSDHEKIINFTNKTNYIKNEDLLKELHETKCKIDGCNLKKWELAKKFHNNYEYIYTSSNIQKNVCKVLPISRSYFKILEIILEILKIRLGMLILTIFPSFIIKWGKLLHNIFCFSKSMKIYPFGGDIFEYI